MPYEATTAKSAAALHILVKTEKLALEILIKFDRAVSFDHLAKRYSNCPSERNGGDLGELKQGMMVKPFDDAVFSCPLLKPYGPVKTKFGYHIIKMLYRR
ncbi:peptidylprolyl isomerase [Salmonella enterica subsp. enterica serovar Portland]|uniref:peptidylprolyl isomerase PpiC n=1 Tax=Salmonella enterica TaxID=28901 RepID=UPI00127A3974|nr:peptidylprolyl isomerase PpiC [Salmonella enterica]ECA8972236.1 peptidylprolyl isomerase [Salmonella enterica subsp. enterica serovar Omuna]ECI3847231.1 peptidylprolyl isomerase [Salmonella enterica subsp. enterica]EEB9697718.1 peptidylprolyl isomerase [Salmonella enterica subsp. enterica serovar Miami]EGZ4336644.1 peptidylprolyl isomerase [Salmonella enterica subsp. enterica serovar Texas]EGZ4350045.1 peptidylprolyl isomerase [Salmonella enterica subsp. enterica serovar Portland]MBL125495